MSGTVVVALPYTSGVTQQEAEQALVDLIERRVRDAFVDVGKGALALHNGMRAMAGRDMDGEVAEGALASIDYTIALLQRERITITNRLEARASLMERLDGSPSLELVRAG